MSPLDNVRGLYTIPYEKSRRRPSVVFFPGQLRSQCFKPSQSRLWEHSASLWLARVLQLAACHWLLERDVDGERESLKRRAGRGGGERERDWCACEASTPHAPALSIISSAVWESLILDLVSLSLALLSLSLSLSLTHYLSHCSPERVLSLLSVFSLSYSVSLTLSLSVPVSIPWRAGAAASRSPRRCWCTAGTSWPAPAGRWGSWCRPSSWCSWCSGSCWTWRTGVTESRRRTRASHNSHR